MIVLSHQESVLYVNTRLLLLLQLLFGVAAAAAGDGESRRVRWEGCIGSSVAFSLSLSLTIFLSSSSLLEAPIGPEMRKAVINYGNYGH